MIHNDLTGGAYAEPYAGGASVGLRLLAEGLIKKLYINDIDKAVFAFWKAVTRQNSEFRKLVQNTEVSITEWDRQHAIYLNGQSHSGLRLGFAAFFLNRTNRSGIIGSGGVIGGRKQNGEWKLDARYNKAELLIRLEEIGELSKNITVTNHDAKQFLNVKAEVFPKNTLIYLDPPYYKKGASRLYANFYSPPDHRDIAESLKNIHQKWIVSYDQAAAIKKLYLSYRSMTYDLRYSASDTQCGKEYLFFSKGLKVPNQGRPEKARLRRPPAH